MSKEQGQIAKNRIEQILDPQSFVEIGAEIRARSTDFLTSEDHVCSDGVVTGYGQIDGKAVCIFAQDPSVLGGSVGEMHARKILHLYEMAQKIGAPVLAVLDSSGLRIEEGLDSLQAFGALYTMQVRTARHVPQIAVVYGNCGGGAALLPVLTDLTMMVEESGALFVHSPDSIPGNTADRLDPSRAVYQAEHSAHVDLVVPEAELSAALRRALSYLPSSRRQRPEVREDASDWNRTDPELIHCAGDPGALLLRLADPDSVLECKASYAPEMVTAFARFGGFPAGIVADRSRVIAGTTEESELPQGLTARGMEKAAAFVSLCDRFSIPVLVLNAAEKIVPGLATETGFTDAASRWIRAYAQARVAKITVQTGDSYGTAFLLMGSKALGADLVYAWDGIRLGAIPAHVAASVLCPEGTEEERTAREAAYADLQNGTASAAARGQIDARIDPAATRQYLIGALDLLLMKRVPRHTTGSLL